MEYLEFIFQNFWTWFGTFLLLVAISPKFYTRTTTKKEEHND